MKRENFTIFPAILLILLSSVTAAAKPRVRAAGSDGLDKVAAGALAAAGTLMVLPVGEDQRHVPEVIAQLRLGLHMAAKETDHPRYSRMLSPTQITADGKLIAELRRASLQYGRISDIDERSLIDRIQTLPKGTLAGVLQIAIAGSEASLRVDLQLLEFGSDGLELALSKVIQGRDLTDVCDRLRNAGRFIAIQRDQGERPTYGVKLGHHESARVGREVVLDIGDTADPEYDVFDWAWCQVEAPPEAQGGSTFGRWQHGGQRFAFSPASEGRYTFLLWAGETLRHEREPACDLRSDHVFAVPIVVEPDPLTFFGLGALDIGLGEPALTFMAATRLGLNWLLWRHLGIRGAFDVFETIAPTGGRARQTALLGAASAGLSWDHHLGRGVDLRPYATFYWAIPQGSSHPTLGGGLGTDLLVRFGAADGAWAAILSAEALQLHDAGGAIQPWFKMLRSGAGLAYRY